MSTSRNSRFGANGHFAVAAMVCAGCLSGETRSESFSVTASDAAAPNNSAPDDAMDPDDFDAPDDATNSNPSNGTETPPPGDAGRPDAGMAAQHVEAGARPQEGPSGGASTPPEASRDSPADGSDAAPDGSAVAENDAGPTSLPCDVPCDDGDPCNGLEVCDQGRCIEGTAPCDPPSPAYCERSCTEVDGQAQCGDVVARDFDGDDYGDARCLEASVPGTDCDDDDDNVHPMADEVCDGIDNDCNDLADLEDGLPVWGVSEQITDDVVIYPNAVWSASEGVYGLSWASATDAVFARMNVDGSLEEEGVNWKTNAGGWGNVAWSGTSWGGVYEAEGEGGELDLFFREIQTDGSLGPDVRLSQTPGPECCAALAALPDNGWVTFYGPQGSPSSLVLQSITAAGEASEPIPLADDVVGWNNGIALRDDEFAFTWSTTGGATHWSRRRFDLTVLDEGELLPNALKPNITRDGSGYVVVSADAIERIQLRRLDADGTVRCTSAPLSGVDGAIVWAPKALPFPGGYVVMVSLQQTGMEVGRLQLWTVREDCSSSHGPITLESAPQDTGFPNVGFTAARIAPSPGGFLITYSLSRVDISFRRAVGPLVCDEPVLQ